MGRVEVGLSHWSGDRIPAVNGCGMMAVMALGTLGQQTRDLYASRQADITVRVIRNKDSRMQMIRIEINLIEVGLDRVR